MIMNSAQLQSTNKGISRSSPVSENDGGIPPPLPRDRTNREQALDGAVSDRDEVVSRVYV